MVTMVMYKRRKCTTIKSQQKIWKTFSQSQSQSTTAEKEEKDQK